MTERRRVVQLLATGTVGGAQGSVIDLMRALEPGAFAVEAVGLTDGPAVDRMRRLGMAVTVLDESDDAVAVRRLAAHLRERRTDVLHAHMFRAELLGARAARLAGTPATVATVHSSRVRSPEDVAALAALNPLFDHLIAPSDFIARKLRREGRGAVQTTVVPNGVDLERFAHPSPAIRRAARTSLGVPLDAFLVGVVARLEPEKGHRHLLAAWPSVAEAIPDAWLVVAGTGSLDGALRGQAQALHDGLARRIQFAGDQTDVPALTAALDVAVMPSLREAQGIAILEALAARRAVVASRVGGIPETIRHGVHGLLVPPADPRALARAILRLAADPRLRARLGAAGARRVEEAFSVTSSVRRTEAIYLDELVHWRHGQPADRGAVRAGTGRQ
jgi:glycosyltransferase involved in cell wall biosynthesis